MSEISIFHFLSYRLLAWNDISNGSKQHNYPTIVEEQKRGRVMSF